MIASIASVAEVRVIRLMLAIALSVGVGCSRPQAGDADSLVTAAHRLDRAPQCPTKALRLKDASIAKATRAALRAAPRIYDVDRAVAMLAARARASQRAGQVRRMCGKKIVRRTVVVGLRFPGLLPSASLSQGTLFVARRLAGHYVWFRAH
jgi:hypothetical protein